MERTWKPITAGILCIIAGVIEVILGSVVAAVGGFAGRSLEMEWLAVIGSPLIVFGVIAIIGGAFALRRKIW